MEVTSSPTQSKMKPVALTEAALLIRDTNSAWFIDNSVVFRTRARQSGNSHSRDHIAKIVHLKHSNSRAAPYFEYIELEADGAKRVSKAGTQGTWAPCNALPAKECGALAELFTAPCIAVIMTF